MNICIIGSGNISTHLGNELKKSKFNINRVCSRNTATGKKLAKKLHADYKKNIDIPENTDLIIIGVPDNQIIEVSKKIKNKKAVIHTSGTTKINILQTCSNNYGVVWPIQTFSKKKINFQPTPICIEANNNKFEKILKKIFGKLSNSIFYLDHETRKKIHLSAVFSCNFLNHLFYISNTILKEENIDFSILKPIIQETTKNALNNNIKENQTGPAIRKDVNTIEKHLKILSKTKKKKYLDIYKSITTSITNTYEK